eukprot:3146740-Ditylum_brightwellii.AAC.2
MRPLMLPSGLPSFIDDVFIDDVFIDDLAAREDDNDTNEAACTETNVSKEHKEKKIEVQTKEIKVKIEM